MADTAIECGEKARGRSEPPGRPPRNRAVMKHSDVLGGLDYLAADYHRQDFSKHDRWEPGIVRFVTSFATTGADVSDLIGAATSLCAPVGSARVPAGAE